MFANLSLDFLVMAKSLEKFRPQKRGYDQQRESMRLFLS